MDRTGETVQSGQGIFVTTVSDDRIYGWLEPQPERKDPDTKSLDGRLVKLTKRQKELEAALVDPDEERIAQGQRDQFGAAQRGTEAERQHGAVAASGVSGGGTSGEHQAQHGRGGLAAQVARV